MLISFNIYRCYLEDGTSKGAWLNRSSIIFAGNDKWSVDPRVSIVSSTKREYSLQIQKVEVTDDGQFTCSVQTQYNPKTLQMHLIVQGKKHGNIVRNATKHESIKNHRKTKDYIKHLVVQKYAMLIAYGHALFTQYSSLF